MNRIDADVAGIDPRYSSMLNTIATKINDNNPSVDTTVVTTVSTTVSPTVDTTVGTNVGTRCVPHLLFFYIVLFSIKLIHK